LSYVQSGSLETGCGGERWLVKDGDVMLHPPHLPFAEISHTRGVHQWLLFDALVSPNVDLFRLYPVSPVVPMLPTLPFTQIFALLSSAWLEPPSFLRTLRLSSLTFQLCSMLLESWQQAGSVPRPDALLSPQDRFVAVITYMADHLHEKLSREELAALVHLHPGYFDRIFRTIYGMAPMQMLRNLRLQRSVHLLENTDLPLSAIAVSCGLGDASYFSRIFRDRYGQSPGLYREGAKSTIKSYIPPL
jgi:AraC-like DNA-binding protein